MDGLPIKEWDVKSLRNQYVNLVRECCIYSLKAPANNIDKLTHMMDGVWLGIIDSTNEDEIKAGLLDQSSEEEEEDDEWFFCLAF